MALFHFHVTQIKRSAGQSAVASAAYRAGEKLHGEYYGEDSDYTKKKGVITAVILLPSHAPPEYSDRERLWNAVEKAERGKNAQLAYSFDIALQNELSLDENIALTRQFLSEQFVSRGMIVDFAIHQPEKDGILYCGKCRTPKQRYFPEGLKTLGIDRHRIDCECEKAKRLEHEAAEQRRKHLDTVEDLKRRCFSTERMTKWNFENDNGNTPQMEYARRYVAYWDKVKADNIGYYLWGDTDSGKSYLAACIANGLIEKEISVRMTNFTTILNDLGASFEGRNEYIERLCRFPLLIIDDLGTERGTEYALEHVYNVIDSRYRSGKPLILTANISPDVLNNPPDIAHARIYSRILEMCVPIHVTGIQNRKQTAQRKMETLKNMMND